MSLTGGKNSSTRMLRCSNRSATQLRTLSIAFQLLEPMAIHIGIPVLQVISSQPKTIPARTVVLPVPGGPHNKDILWVKDLANANACRPLNGSSNDSSAIARRDAVSGGLVTGGSAAGS